MAWTSSVMTNSHLTFKCDLDLQPIQEMFQMVLPFQVQVMAQTNLDKHACMDKACTHIHQNEIETTMSRSPQASLTKMSHNFGGAVSVTYTIHISNKPLGFYHFSSMLLAILQLSLQPQTGEYVGKHTTKRFSII